MEFKLISIASIIAFYGCYFVKMFHQKKQGIQTDQIGKNKVGFVKFAEITMKIAAILVFIAGLSSIFFETEHTPVSVRIFGAILSVAGTAIFIVAVWTMRDSWRAGVSKTDKTELVTNGIYQISRKVIHNRNRNHEHYILQCGYRGTLYKINCPLSCEGISSHQLANHTAPPTFHVTDFLYSSHIFL